MLFTRGLTSLLAASLLLGGAASRAQSPQGQPPQAPLPQADEALLARQALAWRNQANLGDWQRIGVYCDFVDDEPGSLARMICDAAIVQTRRAAEAARVELYLAQSPEAFGMTSTAGLPYLVARIATTGPRRSAGAFHVSLRAVIAYRGTVTMLAGRERVERERRGDLLLWEATMTGSAADRVPARELETAVRQLVDGFFAARGATR
ncbi:hypothetical protein [Falsiroseomonas sp. HW251]|uniref:hypothetical protein n=1 Tax=Falsiroseomonas sp. HW251 TaxID=3390998 RepID=UPI003D319807